MVVNTFQQPGWVALVAAAQVEIKQLKLARQAPLIPVAAVVVVELEQPITTAALAVPVS